MKMKLMDVYQQQVQKCKNDDGSDTTWQINIQTSRQIDSLIDIQYTYISQIDFCKKERSRIKKWSLKDRQHNNRERPKSIYKYSLRQTVIQIDRQQDGGPMIDLTSLGQKKKLRQATSSAASQSVAMSKLRIFCNRHAKNGKRLQGVQYVLVCISFNILIAGNGFMTYSVCLVSP